MKALAAVLALVVTTASAQPIEASPHRHAAGHEPSAARTADGQRVSFQQPQAVVPAPFSAQPGPQGLVLDLPPKSVVVVGM